MNYYLRKNGNVVGPMSQPDFLARIASGEYSATDEMSTDGKVWTRLGLTGYARSIQQARFVSTPRLDSVVRDLTGQSPANGDAPAGDETQKAPQKTAFPATPQPAYRRSSPARKAISVLVVLLLAAIAALAFFLLRSGEKCSESGTCSIIDDPPTQGKRCALLVALDEYDPQKYNGQPPNSRKGSGRADLSNMEAACRELGAFDKVVTLHDSQATVAAIRGHLKEMENTLGDGDEFLFFFSSHGGRTDKYSSDKDTFLCAYDGLYWEELIRRDFLGFGKGVRVVSIISACHSAGLFEKNAFGNMAGNGAFDSREFLSHMADTDGKRLAGEKISELDIGWIVSAEKDQSSLRSSNGTGSLFGSYAIVREGWNGGAADGLVDAVVSKNGAKAVSSTDEFLKVDSIDVQDPCGKVSFLDLALYAVRKWKDVHWQDKGKDFQSVPQFVNPNVLKAFVAGRTGSVGKDTSIETIDDNSALVAKAAPVMAAVATKAAAMNASASTATGTAAKGAGAGRGMLPSEFAAKAMKEASASKAATADGRVRTMEEMFSAMEREDVSPVKQAVSMDDPLVKKALAKYIAPSAESQKLLLTNILNSEHVLEKFSDVAKNTRFEYLAADDVVNADSSIGRDGDAEFGRIRLYGGLVRMARAMGAVLCFGDPARSSDEKVLLGFLLDLGSAIRKAGNHFSRDEMMALMERHGVDPAGFASTVGRSSAEKVANAIVESVLAHEFAQIAKGHLNGGDANHVVSQIEEKEADLFASTIAASVPEGAEVFAGQVLSMIVFSFIDDGTGERLRTHPVPRERVIDAIRANPDYAAAAKLTEEGVRAFYKAIDERKGE